MWKLTFIIIVLNLFGIVCGTVTGSPGNNDPSPGNDDPSFGHNNPSSGNDDPSPGNNNPSPGNNDSLSTSVETEKKKIQKRLSADRTEFFNSIKEKVGDRNLLENIGDVEELVKQYGTLLMEYMGNEFLVEVLNILPKQDIFSEKDLKNLLNAHKEKVKNSIRDIERKVFQDFKESKNRMIIYFQNPTDPHSGEAAFYAVLHKVGKFALDKLENKANIARDKYDQRAAQGLAMPVSQAESFTCVGSFFNWVGNLTGLNKKWPFNRQNGSKTKSK